MLSAGARRDTKARLCADVVLIDPRFLPLIAHYPHGAMAMEFLTYLHSRIYIWYNASGIREELCDMYTPQKKRERSFRDRILHDNDYTYIYIYIIV